MRRASADASTGLPTDPRDPRIEIRRSTRRRRSVSAREEGGKVVVLMPAGLSRSAEDELVIRLLGRLGRSRHRVSAATGDEELAARAAQLSRRWLGGEASPASVRWVPAMRSRWGSCSPNSQEIRVSEALRQMPDYVLDYVLVHELAHLIVPGGHPPEFWARVRDYPKTDRAMGYLEAASRYGHGAETAPSDEAADEASGVPSDLFDD